MRPRTLPAIIRLDLLGVPGWHYLKQTPAAGYLLRMGGVVALCTLVPLGLGILLDRHFETAPLFVLVLAPFGIIGGTIGIVRIASRRLEDLGTLPEAEANPDSPVNGEEDRAQC